MDRSNQPWRPLPTARLDWEDGRTPRSRRYGDIYFSVEDGAAESRHVFLDGSALPQRWQACAARQNTFRVGELGFGTGLNFLLTWQAWQQCAQAPQRLHYWAVENEPLDVADLQRCLAHWPALANGARALEAQYPPAVPGQHRLLFEGGRVLLDLVFADAQAALADLCSYGQRWFDAWYLDGFAPRHNPGMWEPALCAALGSLSREGATVATFSAAGSVRRALGAAGFAVERRAGFGRKRECLSGRWRGTVQRAAPALPGPVITPWDQCADTAHAPASALVVGAGIAGASIARALAARGLTVNVLEAGEVAGRGSGNRQGVLYTRLSHRHSALVDFALHSYLFSSRALRQQLAAGALAPGDEAGFCGMLQLQPDDARGAALATAYADVPGLVRAVDRAQAAALAGVGTASGGLWFPDSGWLNPPALCRALLDHPGIRVHSACGPVQLAREDAGWSACSARGGTHRAAIAVIAAGVQSAALLSAHSAADWLRLRPIRGQTSHLPAQQLGNTLRCVLCHEGYIAPALGELYCAGASFVQGDESCELREAEHEGNLQALGAAVPPWRDALAALPTDTLDGRAELRCASADYLPLAGPVPDTTPFRQCYRSLGTNAKAPVEAAAPCLPGLYLCTGFGSRGLSYAPLAAELLAAQICDEPRPLPRYLQRALAPARFLLRDLVRAA